LTLEIAITDDWSNTLKTRQYYEIEIHCQQSSATIMMCRPGSENTLLTVSWNDSP